MGLGIGEAAGQAAAATIYAASNVVSWGYALTMPDRQAEANKKVLALQKEQYDELTAKQRAILNTAINTYINNIDSLLASDDFENAFPDVPQAAEYVPVNVSALQVQTAADNVAAADDVEAYVEYVNALNVRQALGAVLAADPRFLVSLDIHSKSIQDMMRGILSVGDVIEVMGDNAEQAALTGRIGTTKKTTARDLGVSKMRAQAAGRAEFRASIAWINTSVIPSNKIHDGTEMMMSPQQRVDIALAQSQLIQQSLQNKNNQLAQKAPYLMAELQTKLQKIITRLQAKSSEALLMNTNLPNPALTVAQPVDPSAIGGLMQGIGSVVDAASRRHYFGGPGEQDPYGTRNAPKAIVVKE